MTRDRGFRALIDRSLRPLRGRRAATLVALAPGDYLTDGRRLLRVVSRLDPSPRSGVVVLEDCLTLETGAYAPSELARMAVRSVERDQPADDGASVARGYALSG
jgi:hypothetical protein